MNDFDLNRFAKMLLPPVLRKERLLALVGVMIYPFAVLHFWFLDYKKRCLYKMITNQVISLEHHLNDMFFLDSEIYITDSRIIDFYLYNDDETDMTGPIFYNDGEAGNPMTWHNDDEGFYQDNFIVNVPSFLRDKEKAIRVFVDSNKIAGKSYTINFYDYE